MHIRQRMAWILFLYVFLLSGVIGCASTPRQSSEGVPRISKEALNTWLDDSSLIILDVRLPKDWQKSGKKIKGAILEDPFKFGSWYQQYSKTGTIVLY